MNNIEANAVKRAKEDWVGITVGIVMLAIFATVIPLAFSSTDNISGTGSIKIASYFCWGITGILFLVWINHGIHILKTYNTIKSGDNISCDLVELVKNHHRKYVLKPYSIKVCYYNRNNEKIFFKTRRMFSCLEAEELQNRKTLYAKRHKNFLVILENLENFKK